MVCIGAGLLLAGAGLYLLNPPVRAHDEAPISAAERVPRRSWLKPRLIAVLAVSMAATLVLSGTDVAVVAVLRSTGELEWTGAVLALWAVYSLLGGFAYGTVRRGVAPVLLLAPMAALTIPVGLGGHHWWLLALLLIPAGALCAPTITASADAVSRLTPASARGEAMGWHNSALTVGVAAGSPLAGLVMDTWSPPWGFAIVGVVGVLIALVALPAEWRRRQDAKSPAAAPASSGVVSAVDDTAPSAVVASTADTPPSPDVLSSADSLESGAAGPAVEMPH
jgi:MFS family permease